MIRAVTTTVALLAASVAAIQLAPQAVGQTGSGWVQLFDGKSMDGWTSTGEANWRVEDGALVADKGKGGHLVTKDSYKNFMIYSEFWSDEAANSGIFIRCKDPKAIGARTCYEVNIYDKRPDPSYGTGAIVYFAEVNPMPKAAGKWNTFEITADGRHLVVTLNGEKTADIRNGMFEEGHFTLQYGTGVIKFRKVAIKPL
jgi:3-keto-disaccharide hydrolase